MTADRPPLKIERRRVADQILDDLRDQILSGGLPHGAKLPAERELAARYGVSGPTIREAIRVLTAMGLVASRNGSASIVTAQSDTLMSVSISSVVQFEKMGPRDVFGLLELLYTYVAQLAVERATPQEIASLRRAAERAAAAGGVRDGAEQLRDFHHTLSALSHHPLLAALCRAIVDIQIGLAVEHAGEHSRSWKAVWGTLGTLRMEIVEALEDHDAARATQLVQMLHQRVVDQMQRSPQAQASASDPGSSAVLSAWLRANVHLAN